MSPTSCASAVGSSTEPWAASLRQPLGKPVSGVYGLGLVGQRVGGVEVWGHPGSAFGFQSSLLFVPDRSAVFAGLTNSGDGARALVEIEELWLERVVGARRPRHETVAVAAEALAAFAGTTRTTSCARPSLRTTRG